MQSESFPGVEFGEAPQELRINAEEFLRCDSICATAESTPFPSFVRYVRRLRSCFHLSFFGFGLREGKGRFDQITELRQIDLSNKKPKRGAFRLCERIWRQPTLAEPIGLLPSARLCLTSEFGMGSGRTTALLRPKR